MNKKSRHGIAQQKVEMAGARGFRSGYWHLADEVPVSITFNGVAHAVMMASPCDLEDYAVGFALSERILTGFDEVEHLDVRAVERGFLIDLQVGPEASARVSARRRNLPGQTSCGICGLIELEEALPDLSPIVAVPAIDAPVVARALSSLRDHQPLNALARSLHAAAFCNSDGEVVLAREDVGRHNALDKLIGAGARGGHDLTSGFMIMSSRCSVELVQKAAVAGVPLLATVSAPTTLAIELARNVGLTLMCANGESELVILVDPCGISAPNDKKSMETKVINL